MYTKNVSRQIVPIDSGLDRLAPLEERHHTPVNCSEQMRDFSHTFHQIDQGNEQEAKYNLGGQSHVHGWILKLAL